MVYISKSEEETFQIGKTISEQVKNCDVFLISGSLGAGKSVLIRGIASGLGVREAMPSPTFTIMNEYKALLAGREFPLYHFDFYRLSSSFELFEIGFEECIYSDAVSFIEWPSKAEDLVPDKGIDVRINVINDNEREIHVEWNR